MTHYTNLAFVRARSSRSDELGETLLALVAPSRGEAACISYEMHRSKDDPDLWMVYETWLSADGLDRHFFLPHMHASPFGAPNWSKAISISMALPGSPTGREPFSDAVCARLPPGGPPI